jgi:hypothetical protein
MKSMGSESIVYLQVIIRDSSSPLYVPPDVFIGIDDDLNRFGARMASLYHLQRKHRVHVFSAHTCFMHAALRVINNL